MGIVEARKIAHSLKESMAARMKDEVDAFLPTVDRLIAALAPAKRQFKDILDEEADTVMREWGDLHFRMFGTKPQFGPAARQLRRLISELGVDEVLNRVGASYRDKRPQWAWANGCVPTPQRILAEFDSLANHKSSVGW